MKKCYFILGLILSTTTANAAINKSVANQYRTSISNLCWEMLNEGGPVDEQAKAKKYCKNVANCVLNGVPNAYQLQNSQYMQMAFMSCLVEEANKIK